MFVIDKTPSSRDTKYVSTYSYVIGGTHYK